LKTLDDVRREMARCYTAARKKTISVEDGKGFIYMLSQISVVVKEQRLAELEGRLGAIEGRS